jgi:hypothetical protein
LNINDQKRKILLPIFNVFYDFDKNVMEQLLFCFGPRMGTEIETIGAIE